MRTVVIIQARMGSSRLPGKVLRPLLGRPMLARQLERLRGCARVDETVVATSTSQGDDRVAALCAEEGVRCFRGSEDDVLRRFVDAARAADADVVVRSTGDCPLIDPAVVDRCIARFAEGDVDYVSNVLRRTYPRGLDTEVFSREALERADRDANARYEREHVTPHLYRNPDRFRLGSVERDPDASRYRLTVDTEDDFRVIERIFGELHPANHTFGLEAILDLLARSPDIARMNEHVVQKAVEPTGSI